MSLMYLVVGVGRCGQDGRLMGVVVGDDGEQPGVVNDGL